MASAPMLLYFEDEAASALRLAEAGGFEAALIERHRFPDGELRLRLPPALPAHTLLLRSLHQPNEKLVELLLAAPAARELGARHLMLVAPYLGYMRQDMAFAPGEVVSQRIVGRFLAGLFDALITVDPHLHRVATLEQAVPAMQTVTLSGAPLLSDLIAERRPQALLVGPDEESAQWLTVAAARHGFDAAVCTKVRHGDRQVAIALPEQPVAGRDVVLLDDVASTGQTLAQATRQLLAAGAHRVDVAVTHAIFSGDALAGLQAAGVGEVWSTDCVAHPSNCVSMAPVLAQAARGVLAQVARP
jgi:ribose-phosphate pyrophosphokinase